eukprot:TRINITY_DN7831_c0_g3_i2.p1 TRINITY_DN7831_c0_g3~~TRINITY_DN7831_c0_g3_i2.p1  ORF type:complete len:758 (+),score=212.05 TRINITY_DN7831_c0_g3_i2:59-2275(+)
MAEAGAAGGGADPPPPKRRRVRMAFGAAAAGEPGADPSPVPAAFLRYYSSQFASEPHKAAWEAGLPLLRRPLPLTVRRHLCVPSSEGAVAALAEALDRLRSQPDRSGGAEGLVPLRWLPGETSGWQSAAASVATSGPQADGGGDEDSGDDGDAAAGGGQAAEAVPAAADSGERAVNQLLYRVRKTGELAVQEAASMLPVALLGAEPDHRVLDLCAAPGSKTLQLLDAMTPRGGDGAALSSGLVIANELNADRAAALAERLRRIPACGRCIVTVGDARKFPALHEQRPTGAPKLKFDRVLCDAPCSGDGTMRKAAQPQWSAADALRLHAVQCAVLRRGLELLAPGGRLVYSTCALSAVECEAVVAHAVAGSGHCEVAAPPPGLALAPGLTTWRVPSQGYDASGREYARFAEVGPEDAKGRARLLPSMFPPEGEALRESLRRCVRLLPSQHDTGGFFVAIIQDTRAPKPEPAGGQQQRDPKHTHRPYFRAAPPSARESLAALFGLTADAGQAEAAGVQPFPFEALSVAAFHKDRRQLVLANAALRGLHWHRELWAVAGGLPVAVRQGAAESGAQGWWPASSPWRPCHEAAHVLGRCGRRRVLRLRGAELGDLLRARRAPLAVLRAAAEREAAAGDGSLAEELSSCAPGGPPEAGGCVVGLRCAPPEAAGVWLAALLAPADRPPGSDGPPAPPQPAAAAAEVGPRSPISAEWELRLLADPDVLCRFAEVVACSCRATAPPE